MDSDYFRINDFYLVSFLNFIEVDFYKYYLN